MNWKLLSRFSVVLLLGILSVAVTRAQSAEEMSSNCKGIVNARVEGDSISAPSTIQAGICWGAFLSFHEAIFIVGHEYMDGTPSPYPRPFLNVCAADATTSQLVKVFVHFTDQHPERLNKDYFQVALYAAREAFPCKSAP